MKIRFWVVWLAVWALAVGALAQIVPGPASPEEIGAATAAQGALADNALPRTGDRYIIVDKAASDAARGTALLAAYATAKTMTPTAASQVWVLIPPGAYSVGTNALTLDTAYVNVAGLVPAKVAAAGTAAMVLEPTVLIYGTGQAVIAQTASNVLIRDLELRNDQTGIDYAYDDTDPAAYFPATNVSATVLRRVKITGETATSGGAWATRFVNYAQAWDECTVSGAYSVGGFGTMSGTITNSTISGYVCVGGAGAMSGTISNSTITGEYSVGGDGTVSGTIRDSTITGNYSVGGNGGTISATARLYNVTVSGEDALLANTVNAAAEFHGVRGVPAALPAAGGTYFASVLTDGAIYNTPTVTVGNATADGHALNRVTANGLYLPTTTALALDGAKSHKFAGDGDVLNLSVEATATLTLSDPDVTTRPYSVTLVTIHDNGSRVLTLAGNVSTPGAQQLPMTAAAGAIDVWRFQWTGTRWRLVGAALAQGDL